MNAQSPQPRAASNSFACGCVQAAKDVPAGKKQPSHTLLDGRAGRPSGVAPSSVLLLPDIETSAVLQRALQTMSKNVIEWRNKEDIHPVQDAHYVLQVRRNYHVIRHLL